MTGATLALLAGAAFFPVIRNPVPLIPPEKRIFFFAAVFVLAAVFLPWPFTPYATAHIAGALRLVTGFAFAYLTALCIARESVRIRHLSMLILCLAGGIISVVVILQAVNVSPFTSTITAKFRAEGTLGNPNWAAGFLLPLVPVTLGLLEKIQSGRHRIFLLTLAVLLSIATVFTLSKAGILALFAGIALFFLSDQRVNQRTRWILLSTSAVAITVVIIAAWVKGYALEFSWSRGRIFLWRSALVVISGHLWTGLGLNSFPSAYPEASALILRGDPTAFMPLGNVNFAYNEPIQLTAESGLPATVLFLFLVIMAIRTAFLRSDGMSRGAGSGMAALFMYGFAHSPLHLPATALLFWFFIGWIMAGRGEQEGGTRIYPEKIPRALHRVFILVIFVSIISLGFVQSLRYFLGNKFWAMGNALYQEQDYETKKNHLTAAVRFLPEYGKLHAQLARVLLVQGRKNDALREMDTALNLSFTFDDLFFRVRLIEKLKGRNAATNEWKKVNRDFPFLVTPYYELGRIYFGAGELNRAEEEFGKVLRIKQETSSAESYRQQALLMLKIIKNTRAKAASHD